MLNRSNPVNYNEIRKVVAEEVRKHLGGIMNDVLPKTIKDATGRLLVDLQQEVEQKVINLKQEITNYITNLNSEIQQIKDKQKEAEEGEEEEGGEEETSPVIGALSSNLLRNGGFLNFTKRADSGSPQQRNWLAELDYWNIEGIPLNQTLFVGCWSADDPSTVAKWGFGPCFLVTDALNKGQLYQDVEIGELTDNILLAFSCLSATYVDNTSRYYKNPKVIIETFDEDDELLQEFEFPLKPNMEWWSTFSGDYWKYNFYTFEVWQQTRKIRVNIVGDGQYDSFMLWSGDEPKPFELNPADRVDGVNDELEKLAMAVQFAQLKIDLSDLRTTAKQYMTEEQWRDYFEKDVTILQAKAFRIITDKLQLGDQTLQTQIDINAFGIETLVSNSANYLYVGDNNGDYVKNEDGSFSYVGWSALWSGGYEPPDSNGYGNGDYILASGSHSRITQLSDRIVLAVNNSGKLATLALGSNTFGSEIDISADQITVTGTTAFVGSDLSSCTIDGGAIEADTVIARVGISGSCLEIDSTADTIDHPTYGEIAPKAVFGATLDPSDTDPTRLTIDKLGRIWSGAVDFDDAKFSVDENGYLKATDVEFVNTMKTYKDGGYMMYFDGDTGALYVQRDTTLETGVYSEITPGVIIVTDSSISGYKKGTINNDPALVLTDGINGYSFNITLSSDGHLVAIDQAGVETVLVYNSANPPS